MWTIITAVIFVLIAWCLLRFKRSLKYFDENGVPQKSMWDIIFMNFKNIFMKQHFLTVLQEYYDLNSEAKYVGITNEPKVMLFIRDPDLIKAITIKDFDHWIDRMAMEGFEDYAPLVSKNLSVLRGQNWKNMRALLSPAFTSSKMKSMYILMSECGKNFAESVYQETIKGNNIFDTKDVFRRYTTDVIATCAFGISVNSMEDKENQFYTYGLQSTQFFGRWYLLKIIIMTKLPLLAKLFRVKFFKKEIEDFFMDVVKTTIATREEKGITRPDMLQLLMDSREKNAELSIEDITSQAFTFFFGGFDTVSVLMCFAAHEIALNPDVRKRLQEEIDEVIKNSGSEPNYEAINKMQYMEAVVNETLRMFPPGPVLNRHCTKEYELPSVLPGLKPLKLSVNSSVLIPVYQLHRDPQYFSEPEVFNPDRFLGDKASALPVYLPFGVGPRMCIANRFALLKTKTMLFHLLAKCDVLPCDKTQPDPMEYDTKTIQLTPKAGFWLKIQPRKM